MSGMTVGIMITNGLEAVVLTDTKSTMYGRESASATKYGTHAIPEVGNVSVFGAGNGNHVLGVLKNLEVPSASLDQYVAAIQGMYRQRLDAEEATYLQNARQDVLKKAILSVDETDSAKVVQSLMEMERQKFEQYVRDPNNQASFVMVAYDQAAQKIRTFYFGRQGFQEAFTDHVEIGSGADGGQMYLGTKLQGLKAKDLKLQELVFFAVNAYGLASINSGVGGTPDITLITRDGIKELEDDKVTALTNVSGAYLAELNPAGLNVQKAKDIFTGILQNDEDAYAQAEELMGIAKKTLKQYRIPYSNLQEQANALNFPAASTYEVAPQQS